MMKKIFLIFIFLGSLASVFGQGIQLGVKRVILNDTFSLSIKPEFASDSGYSIIVIDTSRSPYVIKRISFIPPGGAASGKVYAGQGMSNANDSTLDMGGSFSDDINLTSSTGNDFTITSGNDVGYKTKFELFQNILRMYAYATGLRNYLSSQLDTSAFVIKSGAGTLFKIDSLGNIYMPILSAGSGDTLAIGIDDHGKLLTYTPSASATIDTTHDTNGALASQWYINYLINQKVDDNTFRLQFNHPGLILDSTTDGDGKKRYIVSIDFASDSGAVKRSEIDDSLAAIRADFPAGGSTDTTNLHNEITGIKDSLNKKIAYKDTLNLISTSHGLDSTMAARALMRYNAQTGTSYTFVLSDGQAANKGQFTTITGSNTSSITFTIPPNSSVPFPIGTIIYSMQINTGAITFSPGSGVTINSALSPITTTRWAYYACIKRDTNTWEVIGR